MASKIRWPDIEDLEKAAIGNDKYGTSTTRWQIGEVEGNAVYVVVTNDPDEKER